TPEPPPPPPPPTDTPTPTPEPSIISFSVSDPNNAGAVIPVASQDNVPSYEVRAGTNVRFTWTIQNPISEVRLRDSVNDYGPRSPQDEFQTLVTQSTIFRLVVTGT